MTSEFHFSPPPPHHIWSDFKLSPPSPLQQTSFVHAPLAYTFPNLRPSAHTHFVFLQNFVKSSLGRRFTKDLRFCGQLLQKIKVNTIAGEGRTWKRGSKSNPLLCNFLRQIQFLNFKILTSQEACCLSYQFFKYKPNFTKFCTDAKSVSANSLPSAYLTLFDNQYSIFDSIYFGIYDIQIEIFRNENK